MDYEAQEIPIYANPYETTELLRYDNNRKTPFATTSLKETLKAKLNLIQVIKQKMIDVLQIIELSKTRQEFKVQITGPKRFRPQSIKAWINVILALISLYTAITVTTLLIKLNSVLP